MRNMATCKLDKMRHLATDVRNRKPYLGQEVKTCDKYLGQRPIKVKVPEVGYERPPASTSGDWTPDDRL